MYGAFFNLLESEPQFHIFCILQHPCPAINSRDGVFKVISSVDFSPLVVFGLWPKRSVLVSCDLSAFLHVSAAWLSVTVFTCYHGYSVICLFFSDLLSTSSNSECQDGAAGAHTDCPFQRRIIPAHRLRPRRTHPEIFPVFIFFFNY